MNYQGKTALITGASSGIGEVFAYELAKRGMNLILVARSQEKLHSLADHLQKKYPTKIDVIATDLSLEGSASLVYQETQTRNLSVDLLVNNAGFSTTGEFATISPDLDHQQMMLNVVAVVDLTHAFVPDMVVKGAGVIINIGSTTSFYPLAYQAVYGATKAFVLSFSEALWVEYRSKGIKVLALCPGATDTAFFQTMGGDFNLKKDSPEAVVQTGLSALERDIHYAIPGWRNALEANLLPRLLPRHILALLVGSISQRLRVVKT